MPHHKENATHIAVMEKAGHINNISMESNRLPVMEMFYTVQGEGYHTGTSAFFIRLAGCDVGCTWCDVKESWEVSSNQILPVTSIVDEALKHPARVVVITGGEPCMYDLSELTLQLKKAGFTIHLETSGAYTISGNFDWVCVSPKKFMKPLESALALASELKVIVFNNSDFEWAEQHAVKVSASCRLFLQPEHGKRNTVMPAIVSYVMQHPQWRISLQTHKILDIP